MSRRPLVRRQLPALLRAVENFHSPQHDDDGRNQRGRRQHTFQGSNSHTLTPLPSPISGLFDSFDPPQSRGPRPRTIAPRLCFDGHIGHVKLRMRTRHSTGRRIGPAPRQIGTTSKSLVLFYGTMSSPAKKNIRLYRNDGRVHNAPSPHHHEGTKRVVTLRWCGLRWTLAASG